MIRLSRLTDYGIVLMSYMATHPERVHTAPEVAAGAHLPVPTVSKLMRLLVKEGVLVSHRGVKGGYGLARGPEEISVARIISALEGPIGLTMCAGSSGDCSHEPLCPVRRPWQRINQVILQALEKIRLSEMTATSVLPSLRGGVRKIGLHTEH